MTEPAEKIVPLRRAKGGEPDDTPPADDGDLPPGCPVEAVGYAGGQFYFIDLAGQLVARSARALGSPAELAGLFMGDVDWLEKHYPQTKVKVVTIGGESQAITEERSFSAKGVCQALMRACRRAGAFGPHIVSRKAGVWLGADGTPVVHVGTRLLHNGVWYTAGRRMGDTIWVSGPKCAEPGPPCDVDTGRQLVDKLRSIWNWASDGAPIVMAGLIGCAYYGGAPSWRPSGFVIGGAQTGKTMLMESVAAILPLHRFLNDTTAAGVTGMMDGHAMTSVIDEASDRDPEGARKLMDIVLASTGGDGVRGARGTADGGVRTISLQASFIYGSTALPPLGPTHLGRITVVELAPAAAGSYGRDAMTAFRDWCKEAGPGLWGRTLARWQGWRHAMTIFQAALLKAGCAPREIDQTSAILAGFWTLTQDQDPTASQAVSLIGRIRDFVRDVVEIAEDNNPARAARWLLSRRIQYDSTTRFKTVGELLEEAWDYSGTQGDERSAAARTACEALGRYGMRPMRKWELKDRRGYTAPRLGDGDAMWLLPVGVAALFKDSDFASGDRWQTELLRLDGAKRAKFTVNMAPGVSGKAIWVPKASLVQEDTLPFAQMAERLKMTPASLLRLMDRHKGAFPIATQDGLVDNWLFDPRHVTSFVERHGNANTS